MASLAGVPAALRKYGLRVQLAPGWQGHNHGGMGAIRTIVWHHTAGAAKGNYPSYGVVRNGRAGLPGPLAQLGLARDGTVIVFSDGLSYHAGAVRNSSMDNYNAVGIEAESTGYGDWTPQQVDAYPRVGAALCDLFGLPASRCLAHAEVCSPPGRKIDAAQLPGGMNEQRRRVAALLRTGGAPTEEEDVSYLKWDMKDRNQLVNDICNEWDRRHPNLNREDIQDAVWHRSNVGNHVVGTKDKPVKESAAVALGWMENRLRTAIKSTNDKVDALAKKLGQQ